jgi:hypothetical protein
MLQTVLPLNATSQFVKDNVGNFSALSLSTSLVGIGTTSPLGLLHLKTTADTTRMVIDGSAGQNRIITYRTNGVQRFDLYTNNTAESGSNVGSDFAIRAYNDAGTLLSTPFFIKRSTQNVGINNTSPQAKLDISLSSTDGSGQLRFGNAGAIPNWEIGRDNNVTGRLAFRNSGTEKVTFLDDQVGIGITNPTARLQVKGTGSTSATTSLLVQNSAGNAALTIKDDRSSSFAGLVGINNATPATNLDVAGNIFYSSNNFIGSGNSFAVLNQIKLYNGGTGDMEITMWNGSWYMRHNANMSMAGALNVGSNTNPDGSAILQSNSTTKGFLPPRMTSVQKNAIATPAAGLVVYDTTLNKLCVRTVATWETITSV